MLEARPKDCAGGLRIRPAMLVPHSSHALICGRVTAQLSCHSVAWPLKHGLESALNFSLLTHDRYYNLEVRHL